MTDISSAPMTESELIAREIVTDWIGMFDPPPQIDFQQSELLQAAIVAALRSSQRGVTSREEVAQIIGGFPTHDDDRGGDNLVLHDAFAGEYDTRTGKVYDLADAILALLNAPQWRPIESAPKDGTNVLATWEDSWPKNPHVEAVYCSEGVWFYAYDGDAHIRPPTHWKPLDPPPSRVSSYHDKGGAA